MKTVDPTTVPVREFGGSPDDVDAMLRSFFQQERPKSWPAFAGEPTPAIRQSPVWSGHSKRPLFRSRLVLAASIVLILMSAWWLGGRFSIPESSPTQSAPGKIIGAKERPNKTGMPKPRPDKSGKDSTPHPHP